MFALLLLLQSQNSDIVITGERLVQGHAACARGECTTLRDAQASIALAETQFRNGRYLKARDTLAAAIKRNSHAASTDPKPVAALYEAYATVELHEGDQLKYRRAVANRVHTLRDNLPADDPAVVATAGALGDMWLKLRDYRQAERSFAALDRQAREAGHDRIAMIAAMKRIVVIATRDRPRAMQLFDELLTRPVAHEPGFQTALDVLHLRIRADQADDTEMTQLVSQIRHQPGTPPTLIYNPPYDVDARTSANEEARKFGLPDAVETTSSDSAGIRWADVGFWIRPDGRTDDIEILRGSRSTGWVEPALAQVAGRRYSVTAPGDDASVDGVYRVERVTSRSMYMIPTGSNIRRRTAAGGYETLDLTQSGIKPPA